MDPHPRPRPTEGDAGRLHELGYEQELRRGLSIFDNVAMGFATISPVVGLYAVALVGMAVAGPAWVWVLPIALAGQCLLLVVYSELALKFPIANGAYQWSRRLLGARYGWFNGWVALCAYAVANTTIAYLGAPWALTLLGITPTANAVVVTGMVLSSLCSLAGARGIEMLKRAVKAGIAAEIVASVGVGLVLLLAFRDQGFSILTETFGAEALSGGSTGAAFLAALAVGGWVFIGFDGCVARRRGDQGRGAPRAARGVDRAAERRRAGDPQRLRRHARPSRPGRGRRWRGPRSRQHVGGLLLRLVVEQAVRRRRAGGLPRLRHGRPGHHRARDLLGRARRRPARVALPRRVDRHQDAERRLVATTVVACLGLLLGLDSAAIGSLITFGTPGSTSPSCSWRWPPRRAPARHLDAGRWRAAGSRRDVVNAAAVAWLAFETVNIAWPRSSLAPPGAPSYQVWAAPGRARDHRHRNRVSRAGATRRTLKLSLTTMQKRASMSRKAHV